MLLRDSATDAAVRNLGDVIDIGTAAGGGPASARKTTDPRQVVLGEAAALDLGVKTYDPSEYYNLVKSAPRAKSEQGAALDRVLKGLAGN